MELNFVFTIANSELRRQIEKFLDGSEAFKDLRAFLEEIERNSSYCKTFEGNRNGPRVPNTFDVHAML
jgi:hypothetical protein